MSRERASDLLKTFEASRQPGGPTEVLFFYDASGHDPYGWTNITGSRLADLRSMTDVKILEPSNRSSYEASGFLRRTS